MILDDTKVIIDKSVVSDVTPELIATMFAELNSEQQAVFFNTVADLSSKWGGGALAMQLQTITDENGLTLAGRRVMDGIGQYSHWGLASY